MSELQVDIMAMLILVKLTTQDLTVMLSALACLVRLWGYHRQWHLLWLLCLLHCLCATGITSRDELRSHEPSPLQCYVRQVHRS